MESTNTFPNRPVLQGRRGFLLLAVAGACVSRPTRAASSGPLRIVVGFLPGGPADSWARIISEGLANELGEAVIVENKPGASGDIGALAVVRSRPDENMLYMSGAPQHGSGAAARGKLPFDPLQDFSMVATIARSENVLVVRTDSKYVDLRALVEAARAAPGKLTAGSPGTGTSPHLVLELLKYKAGVNIQHVSYRGPSTALTDLIGQHIDMAVVPYPAVSAKIEAGQLRALAALSEKRIDAIARVPTAEEAGFPDVRIVVWGGLVGPAGMDPARVKQINDAVNKLLRTAEVRQKIVAGGASPFITTPEEFRDIVRRDLAVWEKIVKEAKIDLAAQK